MTETRPCGRAKNITREAHIVGICMALDIDWKWGGRRGSAAYARPRKGEVATVFLPRIRGQMTYFVALHELGHVLSEGNRYMRKVEAEVDAWKWALANTEEDPSLATLRGIRRRLYSYLSRALRRDRMHVPDRDSDEWRFIRWLEDVT
jgi:hypothetical protein